MEYHLVFRLITVVIRISFTTQYLVYSDILNACDYFAVKIPSFSKIGTVTVGSFGGESM